MVQQRSRVVVFLHCLFKKAGELFQAEFGYFSCIDNMNTAQRWHVTVIC